MSVEPLPNTPAALVETDGERLLVIADYHAGIETVLQRDGVELAGDGEGRRERLLALVAETKPDKLVILGDLVHAIGDLWEAERTELQTLFDELSVPVTLVKGNHDGEIESSLSEFDHDITVTKSTGTTIGDVGFVHGHTWPDNTVLSCEVLCVGHEHPVVRLEDSVGGARMERVWLRGDCNPAPFRNQLEGTSQETVASLPDALIVFPAFNDLSGGTWVNVDGQSFLSPFLPEALAAGEAYLLDGTRLGPYTEV